MATKKFHDYTKPAEVSKLLYRVYWLLSPGNPCDIRDARKAIASARKLLDEYLASDNLIEEEDD